MSTQAGTRARGGWQPRAIVAIALVWVLLWDRVTLGNVVNGLIIGAVVTRLFPLPSIQYSGRIHPKGLALLVGHFLLDLVLAAIEVARATLAAHPIRGGSIVAVQLRVRSDFYMTIIGANVSLVPGSIVVEARRSANILYIHGFNITDDAGMERLRQEVLDIESRVVRAFGSEDEIAQLEQDPEVTP